LQQRVLIADDEIALRNLVKKYLEQEGYFPLESRTGAETIKVVQELRPDLVILDVMMPDGDGWTVCEALRKEGQIPIIMLTAKGEELDRVKGFELGADDYVVKPFSPRELMARVKALLRRTAAESTHELDFPNLKIDVESRKVYRDDQLVKLTPKEFDILFMLARQPSRVFSREEILNQVWGYDYFGDARTVDTHVKNLREKLLPLTNIQTVWGVGYKFEVNDVQV